MSAAEKLGPPAPKAKGQIETWVSAGERYYQLADGKPKMVNVWFRVEAGAIVGDELIYEGRSMRSFVGALHHVDVTRSEENGKVRTVTHGGKGEFVSRWEDTAKCAEWEALEAAARIAARAAADQRKAKNRDSFAELLEPIARAYRDADPTGRQVILVKTIQTITRSMKGGWK